MRRTGSSRGFTILELVVATFLAFIVVLALGKIITMNLRAWEWGRDKSVLQANATEAVEWMSRSVRAADHVAVISPSEFRTYDAAGNVLHTYRRAQVAGAWRLQQDGSNLIDRDCTAFTVSPDSATMSVSMQLQLQDKYSNKVAVNTLATVRNHAFEF